MPDLSSLGSDMEPRLEPEAPVTCMERLSWASSVLWGEVSAPGPQPGAAHCRKVVQGDRRRPEAEATALGLKGCLESDRAWGGVSPGWGALEPSDGGEKPCASSAQVEAGTSGAAHTELYRYCYCYCTCCCFVFHTCVIVVNPHNDPKG